MRVKSLYPALFAGITACILTGCSMGEGAPFINGIFLDPAGPIQRNTDVHLSADVSGSNLQYQWSATAGALREAETRAAQQLAFPRIAVTEPGYDDVGAILDEFEIPYDTVDLVMAADPLTLNSCDVLFINSSDQIELIGGEAMLSTWVFGGGTLYLSGKAADYLMGLWPGMVQFPDPDPYAGSAAGSGEMITAQVLDLACVNVLGMSSTEITYSSDDWPLILDVSPGVDVLVTADSTEIIPPELIAILPPTLDQSKLPVALEFSFGAGTVLYTCFHVHGDLEDLPEAERGILDYFAAKVTTRRLAEATHDLVFNGGYFLAADYVGFCGENEEITHGLDISGAGDVFVVLHTHTGALEMDIVSPADDLSEVMGPTPLTAAFPDVSDGTWDISLRIADSNGYAALPYILTIGTRTEILQLTTDVSEAVWRSPFIAGEYAITLRVTNADFQVDEEIVLIEVE